MTQLPKIEEYLNGCLSIKIDPAGYLGHDFRWKRECLIDYIVGYDTWRYKPEPTFGKTGEGNLKSIGVDELTRREKLREELRSLDRSFEILEYLRIADKKINELSRKR